MKRKILHYYPDFGGRGGIERYLEALCAGLMNSQHFRPRVICSQGTPFYQALLHAGIPVHGVRTLPMLARPWRRVFDAATAVQISAILRREKPDLVHVHIGDLENLWFSMLGYPVIYTFHGYGSLYSMRHVGCRLGKTIKRVRRWMFRQAAGRLERLLFVSQAEAARMQEEGYLPRGLSPRVLPPGIDLRAVQKAAAGADRREIRASLGVPDSSRCVGFVNRLDANKNPLGFIQFAEELCEVSGFEKTHFLIAGDGPLRAQVLKAAAASKHHAQLHVCGHRSDVTALFRALDLAVFIPRVEGFGLGMVEAMAAGTLCLAHDTGGLSEILGFPGGRVFLASPNSPGDLRAKAVALLSASDRDPWLARLRARARDFDLGTLTPQLEQIYQEVLYESA